MGGVNLTGILPTQVITYLTQLCLNPNCTTPALNGQTTSILFNNITGVKLPCNGTEPTNQPSKQPTKKPTKKPTKRPTKKPTKKPTKTPTKFPTVKPTQEPSAMPSSTPTNHPLGFTLVFFGAIDPTASFAFIEVKFMDATEQVLGLVPFSVPFGGRRGLSGQQQQQQQQHDATLMTSTRTHDISISTSKADLGRNMIELIEQEQQYGDGTIIDEEPTNDGLVDDAHHRHLAAAKITAGVVVAGQKSTVTLSCVLNNEFCANLGQNPGVNFGTAKCVRGQITVTIVPGNAGWSIGAKEQMEWAIRAGFYTSVIGNPFILEKGDPFFSTNFIETPYPGITSVTTRINALGPTIDDIGKIGKKIKDATANVI